MQRLPYIFFLALLIGLLFNSGCKKDDAYTYPAANGTLSVNFYPKVRGQDFLMNHTYYDLQSYQYSISTFMFYVSNLTLVKDDGSTVMVDTLSLLNMDAINPGQPATITVPVPAGNYKSVKFWIGVDSVRNNKGPVANVASSDPLSVYQGTYWDWNTGFRFIMLEGTSDSVYNDTTGTGGISTFSYHVGTNSMYTLVQMPEQTLVVDSGQASQYNLNLDVNRIFYSQQDTIVKYKEPYTHTAGNVPLAQKVIDNFSQAFSLQ